MKKHTQENNFKLLRFKFFVPVKHYYGYGCIIYDEEKFSIVEHLCVISLNPAVFEIPFTTSLENVKKLIYKFKIEKGSLFELTKKFYFKICEKDKNIVKCLKEEKLSCIVENVFDTLNMNDTEKIKFIYRISDKVLGEEIKLKDFDTNKINKVIENIEENVFMIKTKPVFDDKNGVLPQKIKIGQYITCMVNDNREVVKQILKLLYGKEEKKIIGKITHLTKRNNSYYELIVNITPSIATRIVLHQTQKVCV